MIINLFKNNLIQVTPFSLRLLFSPFWNPIIHFKDHWWAIDSAPHH